MKEMLMGSKDGPVIQFLHANAYTPECYTQMFGGLQDYKIILSELRPLWKDSDPTQFKSWGLFADDIIGHMQEVGRKNVIGIGHSMGGITSWLAALKEPDLFSQLILIDPVILPASYTIGIRSIPYFIKKRYVPIIKIASKRRDRWANREVAKSYFLSKKIFRRFDSDVLDDFIQYGLRDIEDGVTLAYPRDWEARVYASPPNMWPKKDKPPCPITIIRAEYSNVINQPLWKKIKQKVNGGKFIEAKGAGHLLPFEQPNVCAQLLRDILDK